MRASSSATSTVTVGQRHAASLGAHQRLPLARAPVSQPAEEAVSNTVQCGFKSHPGHGGSQLRGTVSNTTSDGSSQPTGRRACAHAGCPRTLVQNRRQSQTLGIVTRLPMSPVCAFAAYAGARPKEAPMSRHRTRRRPPPHWSRARPRHTVARLLRGQRRTRRSRPPSRPSGATSTSTTKASPSPTTRATRSPSARTSACPTPGRPRCPLFDGGTLAMVTVQTDGSATRMWVTDATPEEAAAAYGAALAAAGYTAETTSNMGGMIGRRLHRQRLHGERHRAGRRQRDHPDGDADEGADAAALDSPSTRRGLSSRSRPSSPLTKDDDSSVDSSWARATASAMATASGTSSRQSNS